jgi:hypothetical protein
MSPCRASAALPSPAAALVSPAVAAACPAGVELIGGLDGLAERQVAWQDDVFSAERDEHGALYRPRAYPRNGGELCDELVVAQAAQGVLVQAAVGQPLGEVAERADLPPRQPGLAERAGIDG